MSTDQAAGLRPLPGAAPETPHRAAGERMLAVVSGKGGVGKTNLVANVAVAAARRGTRVLVVDGDLGLANIDVLLGLAPRHTIAGVLEGRCSVEDALVEGPRGVHLLPAASARSELAALAGAGLDHLVDLLEGAARSYDLVLIDAAAGVGPAVTGLAAACARAFVVTTAEPTSLADAYATLKVLQRRSPELRPEIVVNDVRLERDAIDTHARLDKLSRRFLGRGVPYRGFLPRDPRLAEAVSRQRAAIELFPSSPWSKRLLALTEGLLRELSALPGPASH